MIKFERINTSIGDPNRRITIKKKAIRICTLSVTSLLLAFVIYSYLVTPSDIIFTAGTIESISKLALSVLILLVASLFGISYGLYLYCLSKRMTMGSSSRSILLANRSVNQGIKRKNLVHILEVIEEEILSTVKQY